MVGGDRSAVLRIGDVRAVPALIRAIPKTLQAGGGDFAFSLDDADLGAFMSSHDVDEAREPSTRSTACDTW